MDAAEKVSLTAVWDRNDYLKEPGDSSTFKEVEVIEKRICFLASRGVGLSLDIWPSRKGLLQNTYLMLDLSCHKCNPR